MSKELGKSLSRSFISKVGKTINITEHCKKRLKERTTYWVENDIGQTCWNVNYAICHCKYAYNNNDGTISVVLENDLTFICGYDDEYKKWNVITIKEPSENGVSAYNKRKMAQERTIDRYEWDRKVAFEKGKRKEKKKICKEKYKRNNGWKGEEW